MLMVRYPNWCANLVAQWRFRRNDRPMPDTGDALSLTPRMHWIAGYAHAIARERGHSGPGAEHLQLAILDNPGALPTQLLRTTGADPEVLTETLNAAMRSVTYRS